MSNLLLYSIVIFSWGTSWLAIKFQLGVVDPQISVAYRFMFAGILLLLFCMIKGKKFGFTAKEHGIIAAQALFMFSTNYIFIYKSSEHLASGLVSVVFSTMAFMNIFNSKIFLKQKIKLETLIATMLGFAGILFVFNKELTHLKDLTNSALLGIFFALISTYSASLGNIVSAKSQKIGLPIIQTTALGMLYGGVWTFVVALFMGRAVNFEPTFSYVSSLLYLSIFASILAFVSYLTLLSRIGPSRAAYCTLVFPIIAVTLSIFFEGYKLSLLNGIGFILILIGNYIVMFKPDFLETKKVETVNS